MRIQLSFHLRIDFLFGVDYIQIVKRLVGQRGDIALLLQP